MKFLVFVILILMVGKGISLANETNETSTPAVDEDTRELFRGVEEDIRLEDEAEERRLKQLRRHYNNIDIRGDEGRHDVV